MGRLDYDLRSRDLKLMGMVLVTATILIVMYLVPLAFILTTLGGGLDEMFAASGRRRWSLRWSRRGGTRGRLSLHASSQS